MPTRLPSSMEPRILATMADVLTQGRDSDTPALIVGSGGAGLTRRQLGILAGQFAATLRASGVAPGQVVTIVESNTPEQVVAFLGTALAGAVAAPLNQSYTKDEFKFYMEDAESKLLVVGPAGNAAAEAAGGVPCISLKISFDDASGGPALQVAQKTAFSAVTGFNLHLAEPEAQVEDPPQPDDVALFLHTSGTTSRPKGVPLTHKNLAASIANIWHTYRFTPQDRSLLVMPLFHVHGLMAGLLAPLAAGAAVVLPAKGGFSAATFWQDATAHAVTYYTAVPTIHQILVARADQDFPKGNPPPLRVIRSCSSSLAPATLKKVEQAFGAPVLEAYAMTEAAHQMTSNPLPPAEHRPGSVGQAQGSVSVAILDPVCTVLGPGQVGEVCIRGPNVTAGYRHNPAANEEAFAGGWFHTGDSGVLDEGGYLTLVGRLKELINRGGEKISPIEVDGVLLSHPVVAEAVSFAAPDEKYGEVVAAAVVLTPQGQSQAAAGADVAADIKGLCASRLAAFKVPTQIFITGALPKSATGKIQRRFMAEAFMPSAPPKEPHEQHAKSGAAADTYFLTARALARLGVRHMFGVIGIPVTRLASAAQACGIRFISCRNEQAAGYAASVAGMLTGMPGVLLTVSGPGVVHALAGLSNAQANCWPLVMISGSCPRSEIGKGAFQELDQVATVRPYVKSATQCASPADVPRAIAQAFAATGGRPGAAYVDLPSDVLMAQPLEEGAAEEALQVVPASFTRPRPEADAASLEAAMQLLRTAQRPLFVIGKGAAYAAADSSLRRLVQASGIPFLATSMARGVVPDSSPQCVNAARSMALAQADVAVLFGARLNWQLHFGEPPKWSPAVRFVLVDPEPSHRDASLAAATLKGDAGAVADQLLAAFTATGAQSSALDSGAVQEWAGALAAKAAVARDKLEAKMQPTAFPLDYPTALRVIRDEIAGVQPAPVVVAEGANTMDQARVLLGPVNEARCRLDAGTHGTMGVGPGYALAAAVARPERCVVAVEGDSAFGFSAMEVETACRYALPITFVVFNNGGIYGGDRREEGLRAAARTGLAAAGVAGDPPPTAFVPGAQYELLAKAFGGVGAAVDSAAGLQAALHTALATHQPTVINVAIDPLAGVESGNVHAFNAPRQQAG